MKRRGGSEGVGGAGGRILKGRERKGRRGTEVVGRDEMGKKKGGDEGANVKREWRVEKRKEK